MPANTALVVLVVSLLMLVLPGLLTAAAFGLRGWLAAATAPLLTYGIVGAAGPVLPAIGILWSPAAFAAVSLAFSAVVAGATRSSSGSARPDSRPGSRSQPEPLGCNPSRRNRGSSPPCRSRRFRRHCSGDA
jgi:hypothetical protein